MIRIIILCAVLSACGGGGSEYCTNIPCVSGPCLDTPCEPRAELPPVHLPQMVKP